MLLLVESFVCLESIRRRFFRASLCRMNRDSVIEFMGHAKLYRDDYRMGARDGILTTYNTVR